MAVFLTQLADEGGGRSLSLVWSFEGHLLARLKQKFFKSLNRLLGPGFPVFVTLCDFPTCCDQQWLENSSQFECYVWFFPFTRVSLHFIQPVRDQAFSALERLMCLRVCAFCYWKKLLSDPLRTRSVTVTLVFTVGRVRWRELSRERLGAAGEESSHALVLISWFDTVQVFQRFVRQNQQPFKDPRTQLSGLGGAFNIS